MLKHYVMESIGEKEREAVEKAEKKIELLIKKTILEFLIIVLINLSVIIFVPLLLDSTDYSKIIISICIWITFIYTFYTLPYDMLYQFVFRYKLSFYQFLYAEVKKEVFEEFEKLNILTKIVTKQFGKSKNHIIHSITEKTYSSVKKTVLFFIIVLIITYVTYMYFRDKLTEINLHSNFIDLLLFPYTYFS